MVFTGIIKTIMKSIHCQKTFTKVFSYESYLTESVYKVVVQKSIPAQIRQRTLYISTDQRYVDEFVWELTFAKRLQNHFL